MGAGGTGERMAVGEAFSAAVLAGGFGRRLGRDKASCPLAGRPLLHWTVAAAVEVAEEIVVVRRPDQELPRAEGIAWREAVDRRHDRGPLAGLEAALGAARNDLVVLLACDMPLLRGEAVRVAAAGAAGVEIAMPLVGGQAQPLLGAYRKAVLGRAERLLDEGEGRLRALLPLAAHRMIGEEALRRADAELVSFTNVNRPGDLERVAAMIEHGAAGAAALREGAE